MSYSDTEVGPGAVDELPEVNFGEEILGSPPGLQTGDPVVEAMEQADIDASDLEQEIQSVVGNEALSQLLAKANQLVKDANARTKEANARNRTIAKEKDAAEKRVECLELTIREYDGASVSSLVPALRPVVRQEVAEVTAKIVRREVGMAVEDFKSTLCLNVGGIVLGECKPIRDTLKAVMGGLAILMKGKGETVNGGVAPAVATAAASAPPTPGLLPAPASLPRGVGRPGPAPMPVPAPGLRPAPVVNPAPAQNRSAPRGRSLGMDRCPRTGSTRRGWPRATCQ